MDRLLKALREPGAGRPSVLARVVAALLVVGLLGLSAPVLATLLGPVLRWLGDVLL